MNDGRVRFFSSIRQQYHLLREERPWRVEVIPQRIQRISGEISALEQANRKLGEKTQSLSPDGVYIVIDTHTNRLYLRERDRVILDVVVSTGSGEVLLGPGGQKWIFDTPRGVFKVLRKIRNPVWTKPDWAFVEERTSIPSARSPERRVEGYLGEYALYIGDGYMIHGTLYTRMLGKSVTHGCIRLDDKDLESLYNAAKLGTTVYIY